MMAAVKSCNNIIDRDNPSIRILLLPVRSALSKKCFRFSLQVHEDVFRSLEYFSFRLNPLFDQVLHLFLFLFILLDSFLQSFHGERILSYFIAQFSALLVQPL